MGPRITFLLILVLAIAAGVALGVAGSGRREAATVALEPGPRQEAALLRYPAGRAHPEGPDPRDGWSKPKNLHPWAATPMWTGGGRHPLWRGCRHVYDPRLGRLIFSSAAGKRTPPPH